MKKINLDKGIYKDALTKNLSVSEILEFEDPSENYKGTSLENTDAFQRQLIARGLNIRRSNLEAFYDPDNRALFPEFISRQIALGKLLGKNEVMVGDIIAMTTEIDGGSYQAPSMDVSSSERYADIAEGAEFPEIPITVGSRTLTLAKRGFKLLLSYEARRRISISYFQNALLLLGKIFSIQQVELALTAAIASGCGSDTSAVSGTLDYDDLVDFDQEFSPYESKLWIGDKTTVKTILKMAEFKDPQSGFKYQSTGEIVSPMGNSLKRFSGSTPSLTSLLVGIDTDFALELVKERAASLVEIDKVIDGQWDRLIVSEVFGFSRIQDTAVRKLDYS